MKKQTTNEILHFVQDNDTFLITYYAKKYSKIITRKGTWTKPNTDTQGKHFTSNNNDECFIYWDLDATPNENGNQWRKAINPLRVMVEIANSTILNTIGEVENE